MLSFSILGSGSSGNAAYVTDGRVRLLVDVGLSALQIYRRLESLGVWAEEIDAIVLTHEHGDHVRGLEVFSKKVSCPVYATAATAQVVSEQLARPVEWRLLENDSAFTLGELQLQAFSVPHDAVDPIGLRLSDAESALGFLSDVGSVTHLIADYLQGVDSLFVEANYEEKLLHDDTKRPWSTKQRILSRHGHLSNADAADLVARLDLSRLQRVVLGHLSQDCNEPTLARETVARALQALDCEIEVLCAEAKVPTALFPVVSRERVALR